MNLIPFSELASADLVVDAIYEGGNAGNHSDDAITKLLPGCGNQGGFRAAGKKANKKFVVLYTSGEDKDWPDTLDIHTGQFVYYGDNKTPGEELHSKAGNQILRRVFDHLHHAPRDFSIIPPFLVFPEASDHQQFSISAIQGPGRAGLPRTPCNRRFDRRLEDNGGPPISELSRHTDGAAKCTHHQTLSWLNELTTDVPNHELAPSAWREWMATGRYVPLTAEPTTIIRDVDQQTPDTYHAKKAI